MTLEEMKQACGGNGLTVSFQLPRMSSNGYTIRLTPHSGPVGEAVCGRVGYTVGRFNREAVLRWIERQERAH